MVWLKLRKGENSREVSMFRKMRCLCLVFVCPVICACTPSSPHQDRTYPVSGTVTLDGEPLADGEIHFITRAEGALDIVPIQGGKFEGQAKAGKRRVEIHSFREGEPMAPFPGADPEPTRVDIIPARYASLSELEEEVTKEGPNQFTFELVSDGSAGGTAPASAGGAAPESGGDQPAPSP